MILIGQYDSPFVRRVGIALTLYGMAFEHRPWSGFGDADKIAPINPLIRVPTMVLDNGDVLTDSQCMLDYLDRLVPPEQALFPIAEPARHRALYIAALGIGIGEKAVSLFYELRLHAATSEVWITRCQRQILGVMRWLETDRAARPGPYWFGEKIGHADIAIAAALRFVADAHPGLVDRTMFPLLDAHCATLEALPVFQTIQQEFIPPA
jgi:glutathione S-transferase